MQDKDKKKTYAWSSKDGRVYCCTSDTSSCTVSKLWEAARLSSFHDAELQQATKEINGILDGVKRRASGEDRELSFIQIKDRHFLVWAHEGLVGPHDDDVTVRKMLKLKAK